jgi:transposase-like protein
MTIQHGTARTSYGTKAPGCDLRDTAVGGAIRHGSPEAVERFRQILAARDAGREVGAASVPEVEEKSMETTTVAANNGAAEIVDNKASREFEKARKRPADPRPVTIEQAVEPKKYTVLTDDQVRQAHAEYVESGDSLRAVARRWQVSDTTMSKRWSRLGLRTPKPNKRREQKRAITATPQQPATAVTLAADPEPVAAPDADPRRATIGYNILRGLLLLLPEDARWTASDRGKHLTAYTAVLDLVTEVKEK